MNKKYVLDNTTSSTQMGVIVASLSLGCFFFLFFFIDWDWGSIVLGIIAMLFSVPLNMFMKLFSEVYTDGTSFFIKNIYQKEQRIDAALFDRIIDMRTVIPYRDSRYYTILFKNGMKFHFMKKTTSLLGPPPKDKAKLAEELTKAVNDFLKAKTTLSFLFFIFWVNQTQFSL
ncbi:hypothetical protein L3C95_32665 [Chitinophaga filiformis]|uniref:hypothetical protein n=1 Tax=Chitinophaga filiformis TaxID=104663 RepID=UPI001F2E26C1|nr:hypothetical protein [Chitinophaga filiformis]MCF6407608.1 hypothetical protein [Chitinophaga filiformis]MCF6407687.1 hypothetical protein [Chitinophaga filiformis]